MGFKWCHELLRPLFCISPLLQPALLICHFLFCPTTWFPTKKPSCQQFSKPKTFRGSITLYAFGLDNFQEQGVSFWQEGAFLTLRTTPRVSTVAMTGIKDKCTSIPQFAMNTFTK